MLLPVITCQSHLQSTTASDMNAPWPTNKTYFLHDQIPALTKKQLKLEMQMTVLKTRKSFGKIWPVFPLQSKLKNTRGTENIANHYNNSWHLLERETIQPTYICLLSTNSASTNLGRHKKFYNNQVRKIEGYVSCVVMLLL